MMLYIKYFYYVRLQSLLEESILSTPILATHVDLLEYICIYIYVSVCMHVCMHIEWSKMMFHFSFHTFERKIVRC